MKDNQPSLTALFIAHVVLVLGYDSHGRSHLPTPASGDLDCSCYWQVQRDLLQAADLPTDTAHYTVLRAAAVPPWIIRRLPCWVWKNGVVGAKLLRFWTNRSYQRDLLIGIGFRKCWLQEQVEQALLLSSTTRTASSSPSCNDDHLQNASTAIRQVLVIGAGYDTLAYRLSKECKYRNVVFWEVDHPATGKVKQKALSALFNSQKDSYSNTINDNADVGNNSVSTTHNNLHTLHVDLTKTKLSEEFRGHGKPQHYDPDCPTVVIMEGLLYYLTNEQVVKALFADVAKIVGPGSIVAFNFIMRDGSCCAANAQHTSSTTNKSKTAKQTTKILERLAKIGEPMQWGVDPEDLPDFFRDSEWEVATPVASLGREHLVAVKKLRSV